MAAPFEFQINLTGNFASALVPVKQGIADADRGLGKATQGLRLFEAEMGRASGEAAGFGFNLQSLMKGGSLFTFDLASAAGFAFEAVSKVVEKVVDLGREIVKVAGDTQDLDLAIKLNVGDEKAKAIDALAESFSNTRFDDDFIKASLLPLLEQGMTDTKMLADLTAASIDIATRRKTGEGGVTSALGAFQRIALKGEVDARALRELAIGEADYFKDLGRLLGVTAKTAESQAKAGKVAKETLLSVALHQVGAREGGAIGGAAMEGAKTLGGTLQRLSNLKDNLLKELADTPGIHQLQEVLDNFIKTMSGPEGKQLMKDIGEGIADAAKAILGFLSGPDGMRNMVSTVREVIAELKSAWTFLRGMVETTVGAFSLLKNLTVRLSGAGTAENDQGIKDALHTLGMAGAHTQLSRNPDAASMIGAGLDRVFGGDTQAGLKEGVASLASSAQAGGEAAGDALKRGLDTSLEAHSPSQAMRRRGLWAAQGFGQGLDAGAAEILAARQSLAGSVLGEGGAAAPGAASSSVVYHLEAPITIYASSPTEAGDAVESRLLRLLDRMKRGLGGTS